MALDVLSFTVPDTEETYADMAMGHVPFADLLSVVKTRDPAFYDEMLPHSRLRYDYAIFNNDESVVFNVAPDTPGAKPVTVIYYDSVPGQGPGTTEGPADAPTPITDAATAAIAEKT